jgi:hypothetical protein
MYYSKVFKDKKLWHRQDFYKSSNKPQMDGFYIDKELKIQQDTAKYYLEDGNYIYKEYYEAGHERYLEKFYSNGKLWCYAFFNKDGSVKKTQGWDGNGNEIANFIFQKEAQFPGGAEGWYRYLEKNLQIDLPTRNGAPVGRYTVTVSFLINKEGKTDGVTAENDPGYGTAQEAVRVIKESGDWIPAVQYGQKVVYRQRQSISFVVEAR